MVQIAAIGFLLIFMVVSLGVLVSSWPRADTRRENRSATEILRDEGDVL